MNLQDPGFDIVLLKSPATNIAQFAHYHTIKNVMKATVASEQVLQRISWSFSLVQRFLTLLQLG